MKLLFDANIFIGRPEFAVPSGIYMSVVVLQELLAGAADDTATKDYRRTYLDFQKAGRLLVPTDEDWWLAGTVLNNLQRGRRDRKTKQTPKISVEERLRISHDVLIARTARRAGVTVITDNTGDFEKIHPYCAVRYLSGDEYFGS